MAEGVQRGDNGFSSKGRGGGLPRFPYVKEDVWMLYNHLQKISGNSIWKLAIDVTRLFGSSQ